MSLSEDGGLFEAAAHSAAPAWCVADISSAYTEAVALIKKRDEELELEHGYSMVAAYFGGYDALKPITRSDCERVFISCIEREADLYDPRLMFTVGADYEQVCKAFKSLLGV